jgi:hypothetical protein
VPITWYTVSTYWKIRADQADLENFLN